MSRSARRDPDGSAIRLSLARRVTINTMTAGERVFIDLLPDSWKGPPPGLPLEVIRELSERARNAERALRQQRAIAEAKKRTPIRVRASVQPTFVRFVFEMPDGVGVSSVLNDQKLTLSFTAGLTFDLADAKLAAPSNIASINQKLDGDSSAVEVALIGDVDVHSFREDKNYIVDVAFQQAEKPSRCCRRHRMSRMRRWQPLRRSRSGAGRPGAAAPAPAAPAVTAPAASGTPAGEPAAPRQSGEAAPPKPETLARTRQHRGQTRPGAENIARLRGAEACASRNGSAGHPCRRSRPKTARPRPSRRLQRRAGDGAARGRCQARQRRPAPDLFLCRRHAGGIVSPRRYRVAGVRFRQADRYRADPQQGRRGYRRRQPAAAGKGSGDPHSAQPAANALAHRRRSGRRRELDADLCRCDADANRNR